MSTDNSNKCTGISNTCANCSKEGSDVNNTCNKCKMVMYCNASCKKKHRHKHKKQCEEHQRLAAERAAELHDEALFRHPQLEYEDCPICFIRLPKLDTGSRYQSCCGKVICNGCYFANAKRDDNKQKQLCAFCRIPAPTIGEEAVERLKKRVDGFRDAEAMYNLGSKYFIRDGERALELWHQAGELGCPTALNNIGYAYESGRGVQVNKKKAIHYYELSAMQGDITARHNLGYIEEKAGNMDRALQHYVIGAKSGDTNSLNRIQQMYSNGNATKDIYTAALQAYQAYLCEIKSAQRDEAAAMLEDFKYY